MLLLYQQLTFIGRRGNDICSLRRITDSVKSSHFGKSIVVETTFPGKRMHLARTND